MIIGTYSIPRVTEESACRSSQAYQYTEIMQCKIHSVALTPNIPFGAPLSSPYPVDSSIFINGDDCKLSLPSVVNCQNYLTTKFVGVLPYEDYSDGHFTPMGTEFVLMCRNGNPNSDYRAFGSADGVHGYGTTQIVKTTTDGLTPKLPTSDAGRKFLRGDGVWAVPEEHKLNP